MHRISRLTAACLVLGLLLAGCTDGDGEGSSASTSFPAIDADADAAALAGVDVTADPGAAPVVTFDAPLSVTGPIARLIHPGEGEIIDGNKALVANLVTINGSNESEEGNTYDGTPQILMTDEANMPAVLLELVVGAQTGTRVLMAAPVSTEQTNLWVFEIDAVLDLPAQAEGTQVEPRAGLPLVGYADSATTEARMPVILPPDGLPPTELAVQPLVVGSGPEITADSSLVVQVIGSLWDGTQFQNSWENGAGLPIVLSGAIRGWREGLVGQTIGSQVMLVVPPELAYGEKGKGDLIPPGSTLIYVIDILAGI